MPYKKGESGVYRITNRITEECYIGGSVNIPQRWSMHRHLLRHGRHKNPRLQEAYKQYGKNAFLYEVLEVVPHKELLLDREQYYLDMYAPAYNVWKQAGSRAGMPHSPETIAKISQAKMGGKPSEEVRAKLSQAHKGRVVTEETRAKLRAVNSTPEARARSSAASQKRIVTEEMRANLVARNLKRWNGPDAAYHRAKITMVGKANRGRRASEETRVKMREAQQRRFHPKDLVAPTDILPE